ncbi:hypothetical protein BDZ97DRAFT_2059281 [Flammula alnicola]|nr:hypothetical protein BDZ97DRAFT_2059281 [Flammula alnicola]
MPDEPGQVLLTLQAAGNNLMGGHKIWCCTSLGAHLSAGKIPLGCFRASERAGAGGLAPMALDDGPIWGGADGKQLSTMQQMMSGVVFWVLLIVAGASGHGKNTIA